MTCGIVVPWLGIETVPSVVNVQSLNHWTTREFPVQFLMYQFYLNKYVEIFWDKWKMKIRFVCLHFITMDNVGSVPTSYFQYFR